MNNLSDHQKDIVRASIQKFGISRQGILRHINSLIKAGKITAHGKTKDRYYEIVPAIDFSKMLQITPQMNEQEIGAKFIFPYLSKAPKKISTICEYGLTNCINNSLSHANAHHLTLSFKQTSQLIQLTIQDDGVGVFETIQKAYQLRDYRQAAYDLVKGKKTNSPANYLGESLFFVMRLFDGCKIQANGLCLSRKGGTPEWVLEACDKAKGTTISLFINTNSKKDLYDVLGEYSTELDSPIFNRTVFPLSLMCQNGEKLMSRAQATNVLRGLKLFQEVCLDFQTIDFVGPAFMDELFRVYPSKQKETHLTWVHATPSVEKMIWRALNQESNAN